MAQGRRKNGEEVGDKETKLKFDFKKTHHNKTQFFVS